MDRFGLCVCVLAGAGIGRDAGQRAAAGLGRRRPDAAAGAAARPAVDGRRPLPVPRPQPDGRRRRHHQSAAPLPAASLLRRGPRGPPCRGPHRPRRRPTPTTRGTTLVVLPFVTVSLSRTSSRAGAAGRLDAPSGRKTVRRSALQFDRQLRGHRRTGNFSNKVFGQQRFKIAVHRHFDFELYNQR